MAQGKKLRIVGWNQDSYITINPYKYCFEDMFGNEYYPIIEILSSSNWQLFRKKKKTKRKG